MEHYLDHSSTTPPSETALRAMNEAAAVWGNPSSVHAPGRQAAALLTKSRETVARSLGLARFSKDKVIFTASGTEANNLAMLGCARSKQRDAAHPGTVLLSAGEHPSVDGPATLLEKEGYDVVRIPTFGGVFDEDALEKALREARTPVIFAAFMLVNNETGAVYNVKNAASLVKNAFPDAVIHCDAVQGYMKRRFTPASLGVDTLTVSAHKIHSIRGAAALFVSSEVVKRRNLTAVMPGGGQEDGYRSGTENLCAIGAFAAAAEEGRLGFDDRLAQVQVLRTMLDEGLSRLDVKMNRPAGEWLPHIANIVLPGIRSEIMLNYLSGRGIYVSAGSACSAHSRKKSAALEAFGATPEEMDCAIRISLSHTNTAEDVEALLSALEEGIGSLQRKR